MFSVKGVAIHKHKLVSTNGFDTLEIMPRSPFQIFLGTNGAGKSVLLNLIARLVPSAREFSKGGYFNMTLSQTTSEGQREIKLNADFSTKSGHYSFAIDGEEQNEGHTNKVQKRLVEKHLGISDTIIDLLIGKVKFTELTATQRQAWIMRISNANMEFAMRQFKRATSMERDAIGAQKHVSGKLLALKERRNKSVNLEKMKNDIQSLSETVEGLNRAIATHPDVIDRQYNQQTQAIKSAMDDIQLHENRIQIELNGIRQAPIAMQSSSAVKDILNRAPIQMEGIRTQMNALEQEIHEILEKLKLHENKSEGHSLEELEEILKRHRESLSKYTATSINANIDMQSNDRLQRIGAFITSTLSELPHTEGTLYSKGKIREMEINQEKEEQEISRIKDQLTQLHQLSNKAVNTPHVDCPNCNERFQPGMGHVHLDRVNQEIEDVTQKLRNSEIYLEECKDYLSGAYAYRSAIESIRTECAVPGAQLLWDWLIEEEIFIKHPRSNISKVTEYMKEIDATYHIGQIEKDIAHYTSLIEVVKYSNQDLRSEWTQRHAELKHRHSKAFLELNEISEQHKIATVLNGHYDALMTSKRALTESTHTISQLQFGLIDTLKDRVLLSAHAEARDKMEALDREYREILSLDQEIANYETQIQDLKRDAQAYNRLKRRLSPTDGFIAEQLGRFVNVFLGRVNQLIGRVWHASLTVESCMGEDGELDYKFPVSREGVDLKVPDISDCSFGQKEILNFAFRQVIADMLGLKHIPLYIDELGVNFDEVHRARIMTYLRDSVYSGEASQLWIISHFAVMHGMLANPDILVLNPANISLPEEYNEHAVMS